MVRHFLFISIFTILMGCGVKNNIIDQSDYQDYDLDKYIKLNVKLGDDTLSLGDKSYLTLCMQNNTDWHHFGIPKWMQFLQVS